MKRASRPSANAQLPGAQPGELRGEGEEQRDALSDGDRSRRRVASRQRLAQGRRSTLPRGKDSGIAPIVRIRNGTVAAFATAIMWKRAPKAEANLWRRSAQQSAPSSVTATPAMAASIHRSGMPSGAGPIVRTAIRQVIPHEPELSGSPRRGGDAGGRRAGACGLRVTWKSITPGTTGDTVRILRQGREGA